MTEKSNPAAAKPGKNRRSRRLPPAATAAGLRRWALQYLERYSASSGHLRRLLLAKIDRSLRLHGPEETADKDIVDSLIEDLTGLGLLNDAAYAAGQVRKLQRRGHSTQAMRARLAERGLSPEIIAQALERLREEAAEPDLAAALTYARRRRLGPYRPSTERAERRERDLATLGRRGFPYEVARRVIDAEDLPALEQEALRAERTPLT